MGTETDRLIKLQKQARSLVLAHPQVAEWMQEAFNEVVELSRACNSGRRTNDSLIIEELQACATAKASEAKYRVSASSIRRAEKEGYLEIWPRIQVIVGSKLATELDAIDGVSDNVALSRRVAAAVLKSRQAEFNPDNSAWKALKKLERKNLAVLRDFTVFIPFLKDPPSPTFLADYEKLDRKDKPAVGLYFLSGLIDLGLTEPFVPLPEESGDLDDHYISEHCWWARFPIPYRSEFTIANLPEATCTAVLPNPNNLDPVLAEQWLYSLKKRVASLGFVAQSQTDSASKSNKADLSLVADKNAQAEHNVKQHNAAKTDDSDYRPAAWFRTGMADRLRQSASPKRKTKRVNTRTIDGVVLYSVADARRWWPSDVPKNA